MDDFILLSRSLIAVGLTLLLALLRLDAERFGTAEYYESTGLASGPGCAVGWPGTAWASGSPC